MDLRLNGDKIDVRPGCATIMAPGEPIEFLFPKPATHLHIFSHFQLAPNDDPLVAIPQIQQLGVRFEALFASMESALGWWSSEPRRAEARLWDILWQLTGGLAQGEPEAEFTRARELIERQLHEPIQVADLARQLGVSHNHLTRRFKAQTGKTVVEYIRERRVERARQLLCETTLPIKAVARQAGLGDFHAFNKAMRRVTGRSPRAWRAPSQG